MLKQIERLESKYPAGNLETDFINDALASNIPDKFYLAFENSMRKSRYTFQGESEDASLFKIANNLIDINFRNLHEAAALVFFASSVSRIKSAKAETDESEKTELVAEASNEFHKFKMLMVLGRRAESFKIDDLMVRGMIIKIGALTGSYSGITRLNHLIDKTEEYFLSPQKRGRISILAK